MAGTGSYSNDRPPSASVDVDYAADPASGSFFNSEFKKYVYMVIRFMFIGIIYDNQM